MAIHCISQVRRTYEMYKILHTLRGGEIMRKTARYKTADATLTNNPQVKRLVGHSLGGSVTLALRKNKPDKYDVVTYGAPVIGGLDPFRKGKVERYKHIGKAGESDPIASLDFFCKRSSNK